jgi:hypothetical protein
VTTGVTDTGGKFTAGFVDTGGKFTADVFDTGRKFTAISPRSMYESLGKELTSGVDTVSQFAASLDKGSGEFCLLVGKGTVKGDLG